MDAVQRAREICREVETMEGHLQALTCERRAVLQELVDEGLTQREIAAKIGVSQPRVCQILQGK